MPNSLLATWEPTILKTILIRRSIFPGLKRILLSISLVLTAGCSNEEGLSGNSFTVKRWLIDIENVVLDRPIRILYISDIHHDGTEHGKVVLEEIFGNALEESPDLILLGGDYTGLDGLDTEPLRGFITKQLDRLPSIAPTYGIMGNHEHWTEVGAWYREFRDTDIQIIEGRAEVLSIRGQAICLRGLGDAFTDNYRHVGFSPDCKGVNITITHDPLGVQRASESGIYLAGHTHCSQIRLPLIPAFWTPTSAREEYWCGYGSDGDKQWITSAGVGTSVIPFRLGTQASIEIVEVF